ncbi:unnamed protein product [Symbiodinium natans]|uniref:Kinesin light chain n=1 Tax=Symbiodinium natans TaxID=878477 RepID=A0A812GIH2_9DINO|nr:unnamed protein product [Symbiodinium natans]
MPANSPGQAGRRASEHIGFRQQLLKARGELAEAEPLYREALEKSRANLGREHPNTLGFINNLAALLEARGQLAAAEPLYREVLEARKIGHFSKTEARDPVIHSPRSAGRRRSRKNFCV